MSGSSTDRARANDDDTTEQGDRPTEDQQLTGNKLPVLLLQPPTQRRRRGGSGGRDGSMKGRRAGRRWNGHGLTREDQQHEDDGYLYVQTDF
jgi:hypothetical protein